MGQQNWAPPQHLQNKYQGSPEANQHIKIHDEVDDGMIRLGEPVNLDIEANKKHWKT